MTTPADTFEPGTRGRGHSEIKGDPADGLEGAVVRVRPPAPRLMRVLVRLDTGRAGYFYHRELEILDVVQP